MCNAIVGNFSCAKKADAGLMRQFPFAPRPPPRPSHLRVAMRSGPRYIPSSYSACSLFDSFEMHCRKARSTRGQCESNIGKQFFSAKNFSAAFQDFGPWLVLRYPRTACHLSSFTDLSLSFPPPGSPALALLLSCRPIFSVPPLNRARFSQ